MQFIDIKDGLSDIYRSHDYWIVPLFRALTAILILFLAVTHFTGGLPEGAMFLLVFMAVLASFLPWSVIPMEAGILLCYSLYKSSLELAASTAVFFLLILLVQSAFRGGHAALIAVMPLLFLWHIPYALPLIAGLSVGMVAVVPIALGTMVYYFLLMIFQNLGTEVVSRDVEEMANHYGDLFLQYIGNKEMVLMILLMVVCFLAVFILRNIPFDYSWYVAVFVGALMVFAGIMGGSMVLSELSISPMKEGLSLLLSLLLSIIFILFVHDADYRRTEKLQFEDDSYFYYVKAVPKRHRRG